MGSYIFGIYMGNQKMQVDRNLMMGRFFTSFSLTNVSIHFAIT